MRAIVMSDTHGMRDSLFYLMEAAWTLAPGRIDAYIHCGDGYGDFEQLQDFLRAHDPAAELHFVRGNCDWTNSDDMPAEKVLHLGGADVFVCHGHHYRVKNDLMLVDEAAAARGCSVTLFGHTHQPIIDTRRTLLVNPGSAQDSRLAVLDIVNGRPNARLLRL